MPQNYALIKSMDELDSFLSYLQKFVDAGRPIGFDTEGGYLGPDRIKGSLDTNWKNQFVCGFSLSGEPTVSRYVPIGHDNGPNLPEAEVWHRVKPLLETAPIIAHNQKFEIKNLRMLERKGRGPRIELNAVADTMLEPYVLSEWPAFGQKDLVEWIFGHKQRHIQELFPGYTEKQMKCLRFNVLPLSQEVIDYACEDAAWCLALHDRIGERSRSERNLMWTVEHEIMRLMCDVEEYGTYVDWEGMKKAYSQGPGFVARMEKFVRDGFSEMVGRDLSDLNLGSAPQLRAVLYDPPPTGLGLKASRTSTKTGNASTDAVALEKLSRESVPVKKLLELRETVNMLKRLEKWITEVGEFTDDNRAHANYAQVIVPTGRFAANEPPIQQCPKEWRWISSDVDFDIWSKDETQWNQFVQDNTNGIEYWTGNFRDFIVAAPGFYLLTYDYSQIELRVLAGVSQEPALLRAFNEDQDVHTLTASKMLGKPVDEITSKDRAVGKTQNFALIYGMGPKSLSDRIAVTEERARELYDEYFAQFPAVSMWIQRNKTEGKRNGYAETYFGRKMTIWDYENAVKLVKEARALKESRGPEKDISAKLRSARIFEAKGDRALGNYPIQGGAADYMKIAMVKVTKELQARGWWKSKCTIIMNQHDSLTFEVSNDLDPMEVKKIIERCVVFPIKGFPKIVADWELGQRWGSSTKWTEEVSPQWDGQQWNLVEDPALEVVLSEADKAAIDLAGIEEPPGVPVPEHAESLAEGLPQSNTLIVQVDKARITQSQFDAVLDFFESRPGSNRVLFRTSGREIEVWNGTSVGLQDQASIALIVPGSMCFMPSEEVDPGVLSEDLLL